MPYEVEYRLRRHDGEFRWFFGRAQPLRNHKGDVVRWYCTYTDINDSKFLEKNLRNVQSQLEEQSASLT